MADDHVLREAEGITGVRDASRSKIVACEDGREWLELFTAWLKMRSMKLLMALSLIEFLRSDSAIKDREKYKEDLTKYIKFLLSLRMDDGRFHKSYRYKDGRGYGSSSPYSDGEALLALIKAAKYLGYTHLKDVIFKSADGMYVKNVKEALQKDTDSNTVTGKTLESFEGFGKGFGMRWKLEEEVALLSVGCRFTIGDEEDLPAVAFVKGKYLLS